MKLGTYSKFILFLIHLPHSETFNRVGSDRGYNSMPNPPVFSMDPRALGSDGESEDYQYMVLVFIIDTSSELKVYRERACTGTMIRKDLVITLASCLLFDYLDDPDPDITTVIERPGRHRLQVIQIFINPNFYSEDQYVSKAHDFGLIVVESSKQTIFPLLPQRSNDFGSIINSCIMGGYGNNAGIDVAYFKSFDMNATGVEFFSGRPCMAGNGICLHFNSIMPCKNGDFGGPVVCNGVLYALNSPRYNRHRLLRTKCIDIQIAVFMPVYNVKDWMTQIIDAPTSNLEWMNNPWYVLLLCFVVITFVGGIYYFLVEMLQRIFDPAEGLQTHMFQACEDVKEDEESWYESQWITK